MQFYSNKGYEVVNICLQTKKKCLQKFLKLFPTKMRLQFLSEIILHHHNSNFLFFSLFRTPVGLEDVSKYPDLFAELLARGWSEEDVQKLAGLNLIRVFKTVEQVIILQFHIRLSLIFTITQFGNSY